MKCVSCEIYKKIFSDTEFLNEKHDVKYTFLQLASELDHNCKYSSYWVIYDLTIDDRYYLEFEYYPIDDDRCLLQEVKVFDKSISRGCFIYEYDKNLNLSTYSRCKALFFCKGTITGYERYDAHYDNDNKKVLFIDCYGKRCDVNLDFSFFHRVNEYCEELINREYVGNQKIKTKKICNNKNSCV